MIRRTLVAVVLALALVGGAGGCSLSLRDVPMPKLVDGPTYEVDAVFDSALNLPVDSPVKLDGATIGQVSEVRVEDYRAHVSMEIVNDQRLRAGARAEIRLTSPMGTAFVELVDGPRSRRPLVEGSTIPVERTTKSPDVDDLLSALSVVVTGGSFADIRTIVTELNTALRGNKGNVRQLLGRLDDTVTNLNRHTGLFTSALDRLDTLSTQLARDTPKLVDATETLTPAVRALSRQRKDLVGLLEKVGRLGDSSDSLLQATRTDLVAVLRDAVPVLDTLVRRQKDLTRSFRGLIEFGRKTDVASPGDFSNFDLTFLLDPEALDPLAGQTPPKDPEVPDTEEPPGLPLGLSEAEGGLRKLLKGLGGAGTGGRQ